MCSIVTGCGSRNLSGQVSVFQTSGTRFCGDSNQCRNSVCITLLLYRYVIPTCFVWYKGWYFHSLKILFQSLESELSALTLIVILWQASAFVLIESKSLWKRMLMVHRRHCVLQPRFLWKKRISRTDCLQDVNPGGDWRKSHQFTDAPTFWSTRVPAFYSQMQNRRRETGWLWRREMHPVFSDPSSSGKKVLPHVALLLNLKWLIWNRQDPSVQKGPLLRPSFGEH